MALDATLDALYGVRLENSAEIDLRSEAMRLELDSTGNAFALVRVLREAIATGVVLSTVRPIPDDDSDDNDGREIDDGVSDNRRSVIVQLLSPAEVAKLKVDDLRAALLARHLPQVSTVRRPELISLLNDYENERRAHMLGGDEGDRALAEELCNERERQERRRSEERARREKGEDSGDESIAGGDLMTLFTQQFVRVYDRSVGSYLLRETLGEKSPFVLYEGGSGVSSYIQQIPFDRVKTGMAVVFLQGSSWAGSMFKHIFRVDRIRRVSPSVIEIDLSKWISFVKSEVVTSIMLATSEIDWSVYVLNAEGVEVITSFAFKQDREERLPLVSVADEDVESVMDNKADTPIVVTSLKDSEKSAAKKLVMNLVRVVSSGNPDILNIVQQGCAQGTVTLKSAPTNILSRIVLACGLDTNNCVGAKGAPLWATLLGQHCDSSFSSSKGEGISLNDFADGQMASMDTASGIAGLWDNFIKVVVKLAGVMTSSRYHVLQVTSMPFIAALRDESTDTSALGNLPIAFLEDMNHKRFVKLGIEMENYAARDDSEESKLLFVQCLESLFAIDDDAIESLVQKHNRFTNKRKRDEAAAAKSLKDAVKKTADGMKLGSARSAGNFRKGGGGGRGSSFQKVVNTARSGGGGGGGPVLQGSATKAICVTQLQHRVQGSSKCIHDDDKCNFSHAPLNQLDREKAKAAATKVVSNPGMVEIEDIKDQPAVPVDSFGCFNVNKLTASLPDNVHAMIARAIDLVGCHSSFLLTRVLSVDEVSALDVDVLSQYFGVCKQEFLRGNAEERARTDAFDFVFPQEDLLIDGECLRNLGSIEAVVRDRQARSTINRFNIDRFNTYLSDTADKSALKDLAVHGAAIPVASDFMINPVAEAPRLLQRKLGNCYIKHAYKLWKNGGALVFRECDVPEGERSKLNLNSLHWCPKPLCDPGRWLGDLSNREQGTPINCPESKEAAKQLYGEMSYPLIGEIITSWLSYASIHQYELSDLRIWKEDIRSAFSQFNIRPEDTYKLAFMFANGLILIMIWGFFGWTGAPLVFACFSRAMLEVLSKSSFGIIYIFCDDFIGFGHYSVADVDQKSAQHLIVNVFGEDKVALEKSVSPSTQVEVLGWWIDLNQETIRPSDKSIRKLFFVFFSVNTKSSHWSLEMCQVLASLSHRYSQALMGMRPFVHAFDELCGGQASKWRKVSGKARFAVEMWRVCLILLFINKEILAVSLRVMVNSPSGYEVFDLLTDGSYLGVGALILNSLRVVSECVHAGYLFKFLLNRRLADQSKYQNHREFVGLVVGIILLVKTVRIPKYGAVIRWVNDNTAALEWARKDMCKGKSSQVIFMFYSAMLIKYKLHVIQVEHIAGLSCLMKPVDALSRGLETPELSEDLHFDLSSSAALDELMVLCNPTLGFSTDGYHEVYKLVHGILVRLTDE